MHRLLHDTHQVAAQGIQVRLLSHLGREGFEGLGRVVLAAVETAVDKRLVAATQRVEQRCDHEGGGDDRQLRRLVGEGAKTWCRPRGQDYEACCSSDRCATSENPYLPRASLAAGFREPVCVYPFLFYYAMTLQL